MASGHGGLHGSTVVASGGPVPANQIPNPCGLTIAPPTGCSVGSTLAVDASWLNLTQYYSPAPLPRFDAASTYDAGDGYALVFGGRMANQAWNDTWSFSNGSWTDRSPFLATSSNNPSARYGASMAYDAATGFVVLFGGRNLTTLCGNTTSGDTWQYRDGVWTPLNIVGPSPRAYASLVYDPTLGSVLLFGGRAGVIDFNDTWEFSGGAWTNVTGAVGASPSARYAAGAAYDDSDSEVILFGGYSLTGGFLRDTWAFGPQGWGLLSPATSPGPRSDPGLAFDPVTGSLVLYGGVTPSGTRWGDLWRFAADVWTLTSSSENSTLAARSGEVLVSTAETNNPPGSLLLLFGGSLNNSGTSSETWVYGATLPLGVTGPRSDRASYEVGQTVSFSVYAFGGSPPYQYTWTGLPFGCPSANATNVTCLLSKSQNPGPTLSVYVLVVDAAGGGAQSSVSAVPIAPVLKVNLVLSSYSITVNSSVTLTAKTTGGAGKFSYSFNGLPPGCLSTNSSQWSCRPTAPGPYSITVTVTDVLGFSNQSFAFLVVTNGQSLQEGLTALDIAIIGVAVVVVTAGVLYWFRGPRKPSSESADAPGGASE